MQWRSCFAWYCCLLSLSGALLLAYVSVLCVLEVEYLKVDDKPRSTWVAGTGAGVYLVCFLGSGTYIYLERRKRRLKVHREREKEASYSPLFSRDEQI